MVDDWGNLGEMRERGSFFRVVWKLTSTTWLNFTKLAIRSNKPAFV